jgi:hypothetical protein
MPESNGDRSERIRELHASIVELESAALALGYSLAAACLRDAKNCLVVDVQERQGHVEGHEKSDG